MTNKEKFIEEYCEEVQRQYTTKYRLEQEYVPPCNDTISREEAIDLLDNLIGMIEDNHNSDYDKALKMAIEALKQESCEERKESVHIMQDELISKQAVLDTISELNAISFYEAQEDSKECYYEIRKAIEQLQPKIGHWVKIGDKGLGWSDTVICKCSECEYQKEFTGKFDGHNLIVDMERAYNYCPNCGAKMEVEE